MPSIVVEDDGDGMTLETIRDIWLVPGHDHRARQRAALQRTRRGRLPLGEKGLGRFAAHKLGNRIDVVTRAHAHPECVVSIDWDTLIRQENLSDAMVRGRYPGPDPVPRKQHRYSPHDLRASREKLDPRGGTPPATPSHLHLLAVRKSIRRVFALAGGPPVTRGWVTDVPDVGALLKRAPWEFGSGSMKAASAAILFPRGDRKQTRTPERRDGRTTTSDPT